jgi:hypothetical protein
MLDVTRALTLTVLLVLAPTTVVAQATGGLSRTLEPAYATVAPTIDGVLDDEIWQGPATVSDHFISYWPHQGEPLPYLTEVWAAHDEHNLYFAFRAHDPEPAKIKTSITKRDNIVPEDWVGVLVNTSGNRQAGYGFYSNPSGIQYDELVTANGEDFDPDWVWSSDAQMLDDGYSVEFHIPLQSIVYPSGDDVHMCLTFFRKISRLGYVTSWPTIVEGSNSLRAAIDAVYPRLETKMRFEVLPSATYSSFWTREAPDRWSSADDDGELGVDLSLGITSSVSTDLTINPDFSQVESDTFQILVNQRFPVFFEEKRPFFMELGNQFDLARDGSSNLLTAVHTRRIVDPSWGTKARAEWGDLSLGLLVAEDELLDGMAQDEADEPVYVVGRMKYSLGGDSFAGVLYSGREQGDGYNRTLSADLFYNLANDHTVRANALYTESCDDAPDAPTRDGFAYHASYTYASRRLAGNLTAEHFDQDFQMDTAFYNRTGFTSYAGYIGPSFYPTGRWQWIDRIRPTVGLSYLEDEASGLDEHDLMLSLAMRFPAQTSLDASYHRFQEVWSNHALEGEYGDLRAGSQVTNWLRLDLYTRIGDRSLYDPAEPLVGQSQMYRLSSTLQLSHKISQFVQYTYQDLRHPVTDDTLYDVGISTSRTTYQMNRYLFFRLTAQHDSSRDVVLGDFLISFTFIPGTVLHLGYGTLLEDRYWQDDRWLPGHPKGSLRETSRSVFFKASYRWRR